MLAWSAIKFSSLGIRNSGWVEKSVEELPTIYDRQNLNTYIIWYKLRKQKSVYLRNCGRKPW